MLSKEHEEIANKLIKITDGFKEPYNRENDKIYIPDLITSNGIEMEIEMLNHLSQIKKKSKNWKSNQQRVLVVSVPKKCFEFFNAVLFTQEDEYLLVENKKCENKELTKMKKDFRGVPKCLRS